MIGSIFISNARSAAAVLVPMTPVSEPMLQIINQQKTWWDKTTDWLDKLWRNSASVALHRTITSALNKMAYDTANYIGSGGAGQQPLFVTKDWGEYLADIGDEAAGQFIETTIANMGKASELREDCAQKQAECKGKKSEAECEKDFNACITRNAVITRSTPSANVCAPSSINAKLRITLGLVDQVRPTGPNCTISDMKRNWSTESVLQAAGFNNLNMTSEQYLREVADFFDPRANDLGIMASARADMLNVVSKETSVETSYLTSNRGWRDVRSLSGLAANPPGTPERELEDAARAQSLSYQTFTLDPLVDAANVFVNQLALSAFNNLLRNLGNSSESSRAAARAALLNPLGDPGAFSGVSALTESTAKLLKPNFGARADYNILSSLVLCPDPKNPGPDNCVIDSEFMQAISEKKTVAEALNGGYLHGEWQFTTDNSPSAYSLRNISVLRKYRIVPVGWETAVQRIFSSSKPRKATMSDLVSCFDKMDQYANFSAEFDQRDQGWCEGLVDPNWVLKAPLNYCRQEGVGSQIVNKIVIPGNSVASSSLSITRAENYCADNQTCIKERADGSCEFYGYCNEERRRWNFNTPSCQPINNTCQAFTSAKGETVAYLQNTLDYANCNADNSGCRRYALTGDYVGTSTAASVQVAWNGAVSSYFNSNLSSCDSKDEGCTALLRVKPTGKLNLVMNSDFRADKIGDSSNGDRLNSWPLVNSEAEIVDIAAEPGGADGLAIKLTTGDVSGGIYSNGENSLLPENFQTVAGQAYTLSADVYLVGSSGSEDARITLKIGDSNAYLDTTANKDRWQHLSVTWPGDVAFNDPNFSILATDTVTNGLTFYLRNLKFEMSNWDTGITAYGTSNIYQKLLPPYLEKACYEDVGNNDYRLRANAPAACSKFAPKCNQDEAGCEKFTVVAGDFSIAAKANSADYCSDKCVGYDAYLAHGNYFYSPVIENMIPSTARSCTAVSVGCTEFTNLDEVARGGEGKEYYSALKQCIKPAAATCSTFYSWEGTGSGYQLRSYVLKKDGDNLPAVTHDDSEQCNEEIYNLPIGDADYNPDCRQYYNADGQVAYHLASLTVTCSENCHVYRMTEKNVDPSLLSASQCSGPDKNWDAANNACRVCLNGGIWDNTMGACIYQAIPGEGVKCSAANNGCREYSGSKGANVRLAAAFDFENGFSEWHSNCTYGIKISNIAKNNQGHSIQYDNQITCNNPIGERSDDVEIGGLPFIKRLLAGDQLAAQLSVYGSVSQDKSYTVRFLARADQDTSVKLFFLNPDSGDRAEFNQGEPLIVRGGNEWNIYQVNLDKLNHSVGVKEILALTASGTFYFDDFTLSEITDRYYRIHNSSQIPDACYYDLFYKYRGAEYNLGCAQYSDRSGLKHNLHRFSGLCSDSAVGCEQMIDTANSSDYRPQYFQDGVATSTCAASDPNCLLVPGDRAIYAIYDRAKTCDSGSKGCSRLGEGQGGASLTGWTDVFKANNPDNYARSLCALEDVGCEAWSNNDNKQTSYFKNPGSETCVYRESRQPGSVGKNWFRIPAKRCDADGNNTINGAEIGSLVCASSSDCLDNKACILDNNDYLCDVSLEKTFGFGGSNNQVPVPSRQAGLCEAQESSCTEYIDPVSRSAANLVVNPTYSAGQNGRIDGWGNFSINGWLNSSSLEPDQQFIRISPNKMYSLIYKPTDPNNSGALGEVSLTFKNGAKRLLPSNQLGATETSLSVSSSDQPIVFNSFYNDYVLVQGGSASKSIELKEVIIDYQLSTNADKRSCNGSVGFNNGCILFNERRINGSSGLASLANGYNPYLSADRRAPQACQPGSNGCQANELIKVRPDRICAKWLDCTSFIQDPFTKEKTCYAFSECDRLDDKGECANFLNPSLSVGTAAINQNSSGYTIPGKYNLGSMSVVGQLIEDIDEEFDNISPICDSAQDNSSDYCRVNGPDAAAKATDYPASGENYIKIRADKYYDLKKIRPRVSSRDEYYINYLMSTKNSKYTSATVEIQVNGNIQETFHDDYLTGWTRKVRKFSLPAGTPEVVVRLRAIGGDVYFDDVSIQPVLETAKDNYAIPECRLYPERDSFTCFSKNKNVVTDGLTGYCLEKDPLNPDVCLLWYPMDNLPIPSMSSLGYDGNFPLNYCTQLNGNFELAEYRRAYLAAAHEFSGEINVCGETWIDGSEAPGQIQGGNGLNNHHGCYGDLIREDTNLGKIGGSGFSCNECPTGYKTWFSWKSQSGGSDSSLKVICVPDKAEFLPNGTVMGAATAANALTGLSNGGLNGNEDWEFCNASDSTYATGYAKFNGFQGGESRGNRGTTAQDDYPQPNLRIYDYSNPPSDYNGFKEIPGTFPANSQVPADDYFRFTCRQFVQAVDSDGTNAAWSGRTKDSGYQLNLAGGVQPIKYAFGLANPPYGAMVTQIVSGITQALAFKDANPSTEDFAGKPFGCVGPSCSLVGYCSQDKSMACLANSELKNKTCVNNSTCTPLWKSETLTSDQNFARAVSSLKNIFLKAQNVFNLSVGTPSTYLAASGLADQFNFVSGQPGEPPLCANNVRPSGAFCHVRPIISNVNLYFEDRTQTLPWKSYDVQRKGIYRLEFNTTIDSEQQPLKKIVIDWGDGYTQTITSEDHAPSANSPHVIYHYYSKLGVKNINIRIQDNWNYFCDTSSANNFCWQPQ